MHCLLYYWAKTKSLSPYFAVFQLRLVFYTSMALWEDEETQKNGRVLIVWGSAKRMDRLATWRIVKLASCLPFQLHASHVWFQASDIKVGAPVIALAQFAAEASLRLRVRTHTGKYLR